MPLEQFERTERIDSAEKPDEVLMVEARHGKQESLARLVTKFRRELGAYLRRFFQDEAALEDCIQEVWLSIWKNRQNFDTAKRFRPWLYTVAQNKAIDALRREKRFKLPQEKSPVEEEAEGYVSILDNIPDLSAEEACSTLINEERVATVHAMVNTLPEFRAETVRLIYIDELKYREASERLGINIGTVKSRLYSSLGMLRKTQEAVELL